MRILDRIFRRQPKWPLELISSKLGARAFTQGFAMQDCTIRRNAEGDPYLQFSGEIPFTHDMGFEIIGLVHDGKVLVRSGSVSREWPVSETDKHVDSFIEEVLRKDANIHQSGDLE